MDEQNQQPISEETSEAVKGVVQATKAAVKASAGDVIGAAKELAKNPAVVKTVVAVVLAVVVIFTAASMLVGSAITGTIQYLVNTLEENWDEAWEEQGVSSSGNLLYLYGIGEPLAAIQALSQTISDTITDICDTVNNWINGENATNASLGAQRSDGTNISNEDYRTTLAAIKDEEKLISDDGALMKRLNMIKGRVEERGNQLRTDAAGSYSIEGIAYAVGEIVSMLIDESIFLFGGVDFDNSGITVDTSAFEMTDVQALKIYAAYCVQKDCQLNDIDMWDLMNYCGWYSAFGGQSPLQEDQESIYNTSSAGIFSEEIGGVISSGQDATTVIDLPEPNVANWSGTFAPQWYYEEIAQLEASNDYYENKADLEERMASVGMTMPTDTTDATEPSNPYFEVDAEGKIDIDNFTNLGHFETYGLIDKLFTSSRGTVTISRTEYHNADEFAREALAEFGGEIRALWDEAYGKKTKWTDAGNFVMRDEAGIHSFTISYTVSGNSYYLTDTQGNVVTEVVTSTGDPITFAELSGATTYIAKEKVPHEVQDPEPEPEPTQPTEPDPGTPSRPVTPPWQIPLPLSNPSSEEDEYSQVEYDLGCGVKEVRWEKKSEIHQAQQLSVTYTYNTLDYFTTFVDAAGYEAYEVQVRIDISFASRSVDSLLYDLMGLWPGSLTEVVEKDGKFYAKGHTDNENLVLRWTDTYTDSAGNTHTINFERQQGYQVEAYEDIVLGLGSEDVLDLPVENLFNSFSHGSGQSIVNVARQELEYYTANGLYEGSRYWNMAYENGGMSYVADGTTHWCVMFVMCCAWMAGLIGENAPWGTMDSLQGCWPTYCSGSVAQMEQSGNGVFYDTSDYKPSPGDFIYFSTTVSFSNVHHIGLVADVLPDGSIEVIHGNWSDIVQSTFCDNYQVGTSFDGSTYISAYLHPNYPALLITDPPYLTLTGPLQPKVTARYVATDDSKLLIVGTGRFRENQLQTVVDALREDYPELYSEDLQTALTNNDMDAFVAAWNVIATSEKADTFEDAQRRILSEYFANPLAETIWNETGFDWMESEIRENLFLGIITTSGNQTTLKSVLEKITEGMDNTISDGMFLQALTENDGETTKLYDICNSYRGMLWSGESEQMQKDWISSIQRLLEELQRIWNESGASFGDPSAPVQDQIYYYLTRGMGLNSAAACGVLANIEAESSFDLNCIGDSGTSYGLCQWHNSRYTALINYCSNMGLDYTTVQGQMEYLRYELETGYTGVLASLRAVDNTAEGAYNAAYTWCVDFESPSDEAAKGAYRGTNARDNYWPQYGGR